MTRNRIIRIIKENIYSDFAGKINLRGIHEDRGMTVINELKINMVQCDSEEFDIIREMQQTVLANYNINIVSLVLVI